MLLGPPVRTALSLLSLCVRASSTEVSKPGIGRMAASRCWLLKSEPHEYSIETLQEQEVGRWDGIRNFQARNFIREMGAGDTAYFYHSSCKQPGIYGRMTISTTHYEDPTAVDPASPYFYTKSKSKSESSKSKSDTYLL
jgi:predicted RNA-binding protein with PUA-like domain